jgi:predicted membrane-bound spermidine synthase
MPVAILSGILLLSGVSALLFETLWLRLSGLAFGNSVWAAALILSSFMAGLALGNCIAGLWRPRRIRPLYLYALLEVVVGLCGCAIVFALPSVGNALRPLFQALWDHQTVLLGLRFALSFLILLVPTTAMGLTLPLLLSDPLLQRYSFTTTLGLLYGCNTLGAVIGALAGEAYLIQAVGLAGTGLTAGGVNITAAILALALTRLRVAAPAERAGLEWRQLRAALRTSWRALLVSFGAGLLLLCLEVAWLRFLRLYVASSTTAFAVTVAVVLAGIGTGGIVSSLLQRTALARDHLVGIVLLLASGLTVICYWFFPARLARPATGPFYGDQWWELTFLCTALCFPVSFCSGMLFPLVGGSVESAIGDRMSSTGWLTLVNTIGAAIGPLLATFLLLPRTGFESTIVICAASYALLALGASDARSWATVRLLPIVRWVMTAALVAAFLLFPYGRAETHLAHPLELFVTDGSKPIKQINGTADTLQLLRREIYGEPYYYRLVTNGFSMSGTLMVAQRYMRLFAYLPLLLNPQAKDALLICYGCGVTADALVRANQLRQVDMVDISHEVFDLAPDYVTADYSNPLRNPKAKAIVQDGRFFLQATPGRYDVITGEPPPLKVHGAVNLYTAEFFRLMHDRLNDGGIASFWLPIHQLTPAETAAVLKAFHASFSNASVWGGSDTEWIMVGVKGSPTKLTSHDLSRLWNDPASRDDLIKIGLEVPEQMAALFLLDGSEIDRITAGVLPLADNYPKRLTNSQPDEKVTNQFGWSYEEGLPAMKRFLSSAVHNVFPPMQQSALEEYFLVRESRYLAQAVRSNQLAELDLYLRHSRLRAPVLDVLGTDEVRIAIAERVAGRLGTPPKEAIGDLVASALARRDITAAVQLLEQKLGPSLTANDQFLLTYLYCLDSQVGKAERLAARYGAGLEKDWFVEWLWNKLHNDFGFHPPS